MAKNRFHAPPAWRRHAVLASISVIFTGLGAHVAWLIVEQNDRLQEQGELRHLREVRVAPERGRILDRNGEILSVSIPVKSLAADPKLFCGRGYDLDAMLGELGLTRGQLSARCDRYADADFMYIRRRLPPETVERVMAMQIPGLEVRTEYKRFYPGGPVGAHLLGFTDVDDRGQEGLEKSRDAWLSGREGRRRVLKDLVGRHVESVDSITPVVHGHDLRISVDQRVQSRASFHLETAVSRHRAAAGGIVVLSVPDGEILAMVNSPQFNANDRGSLTGNRFRNRSVTDVFEPGSTAKPFTVAMALESGDLRPHSMIDTSPGRYSVGGHTIHDIRDYGEIPVSGVITRSSNVGSVKIALAHPFEELFETYRKVGFGTAAGDLPGEISGVLHHRKREIEHATMAYGYGFSSTLLQLARAYTVFATGGELLPVTLLPHDPERPPNGEKVFSEKTALEVRAMLEQATAPGGTAQKARVPRYRVAGKTGTTRRLVDGNYQDGRYVSLFAGLAPVSDPRFVMVVWVDDPRGEHYYGGEVAAPVFARLMADLMRLYNVRPDAAEETGIAAAGAAGAGETRIQ